MDLNPLKDSLVEKDLFLLVVGAVLGALASWLVSRFFYHRAIADAADSAMAQRLDDCTEGDKSFLVALHQRNMPIPRYALINVEYETLDGRKGTWGSNTTTMIQSLKARAKHSLQSHGGTNIDEDQMTVSLTDRGRENASYLLRREYRSAKFANIDDNEAQRRSIFRREHSREPQKGSIDKSDTVGMYTIGT